ncbi:hypothetical protein DH2020_028822 [Rehmannia glutinosa]|uniref:Uncharacterized protein n=1 Tax=Rehmannia glutinosa TaxID=99300 RepID=A0ABR0VQE5_REHGL
MVDSIAATSLLGHRPIYGSYHFNDVPNKRKPVADHCRLTFTKFIGRKVSFSAFSPRFSVEKPLVSMVKAQAMELTKEAYSYREEERIPRDFWRVIFEWEGVIVEDNPDLEKQAWLVLAQEEGKSPPPAFMLRRIEGMKNEQAIGEVLCWSRDPSELKRMASRKEEIYQALHGPIYRFRSGSQAFVNVLVHHKVPMALVSTRPRKSLERAIGVIGIEGVFSVIVAAEDVYRGKPDPEMFVYAAQLLQFIPERCIVFGNSNQTVEAAHDARMKCVAVASKHPVYELGAADLVVRRLDELSVVDLKNLAAVESPEFGSGEPELEMEVEPEDDRYPPSSVGVW